MKIAVGASSFAADSDLAMQRLLEKGIEVVKNPYGRKMTQEEITKHLHGATGLLAGLEPLNDEVFSACSQLRVIARIGIGMDNIDLAAAKKRGIMVSNTPDSPTEAVAEMTLAALLMLLHRIIPANEDMHHGIWKKRMGDSIRGTHILIIGYGRIGQRVAALFSKLGAKIDVYDRYEREKSTCTLEEGLSSADVVSLHASGKEAIIGKQELEICKPGVMILNSARGGLIEEDALYEALQIEKVSWYWGDALWQEPYTGKIASCDRAILTPHISTYTRHCRESMEMAAVENLLRDLKNV